MNNSYITIIKEKRTDWSRKRVPLNQNECTADFRISVPFGQNLLLGEKAFQFSPAEWLTIHRRLFEGVFTHAGQIRQYNITKKEWVLKGDTVTYAAWNSIKDTLDYDFATEKLHCYIKSIISNPSISEREKLVILLSHIEPLIYNTLNYTKQPYSKVKQIVKRMSIDENEGMSSESVGKLYVMGITYVVFANTDAYTKEIDKRIPFRNNILHNGIVEYGTDDIHSAYELLVEFISMLVFIKKQLINEKTK